MKKSFFVIMLMLVVFLFAGCLEGTGNILVETDYGVYDLYYNCMIKCETEIQDNINAQDFEEADQNKASSVLSKIDLLAQEELAIVASVECYNMISTPKSITIDMKDGLITVKQQNGKFVCELHYEGGDIVEYNFSITKETSSSPCAVSYKKQNNDCKATVLFDKSTSNLVITIASFNESFQKVDIRKQFYLLQNNRMALKMNFAIGAASNRTIYGVDYFKEAFNFNAKLSSLQAFSGSIKTENLTMDKFVVETSNDICGYILKHKDGKETDINSFGDLKNW